MTFKQFPSLETISRQLESDINRLNKGVKELQENPRYNDNEAERTYLLQELADKREKALADSETKFVQELEQIELNLADRAFAQPKASQDELNKAQALVQQIKTQVLVALEPVPMLTILSVRVGHMTDVEKQFLAGELAEIEDVASKRARNQQEQSDVHHHIDEIKNALADTQHSKSINEQIEALQSIKQHNGSIRRMYDSRDRVLGVIGNE